MCYAIPAQLVEINQNVGVIDYFGEKRNIMLDGSDVKIGDYVYAQGGILVRTIPEEDALDVLDLWRDLFFKLKDVDDKQQSDLLDNITGNALEVLQQVNHGQSIKRDDISILMDLSEKQELEVLSNSANHCRQKNHGNASCVHGIIEFSNFCRKNCHYCGLRREHGLTRYRMTPEEIFESAETAIKEYGFKALVLQSGEDKYYTKQLLVDIVKEIRQMGVLVFLSLGDRSVDTYQALWNAGARAVLMRFETSNKQLFKSIRPHTDLDQRLFLIKELKNMGYILATGFLMGLPGENREDLLNNIELTKSLAPDMYSFGPLIPVKGTPLEQVSKLHADNVIKTIACVRFHDPDSNILVTTALETLDENARKKALLSGANSLMINVTPMKYRGLYRIYDSRYGAKDPLEKSIEQTLHLLYELGRSPTDIGDIRQHEKFLTSTP